MNTTASNSTLASAQSADEATLGWNTMPAYGEVMSDLYGALHLEPMAPIAPAPRAGNALLTSFWNVFNRSASSAA